MNWHALYHLAKIMTWVIFVPVMLEWLISIYRHDRSFKIPLIHTNSFYVWAILTYIIWIVVDVQRHSSASDKIWDALGVAIWTWLAIHDDDRKNRNKRRAETTAGAKTRAVFEKMAQRMREGVPVPVREGE